MAAQVSTEPHKFDSYTKVSVIHPSKGLTVTWDAEQLRQVREASVLQQMFVDQPGRVFQRFSECSCGAAGSSAGRHGWATSANLPTEPLNES